MQSVRLSGLAQRAQNRSLYRILNHGFAIGRVGSKGRPIPPVSGEGGIGNLGGIGGARRPPSSDPKSVPSIIVKPAAISIQEAPKVANEYI